MEYTSTVGSIESYFPLVDKILKFEIRGSRLRIQTQDDLRSHGMEGLMAAMRSYDPSRGVAFQAYAAKRIRWAIYDGMRSMGWFPRQAVARARFYRKAEEMSAARADIPAPTDSSEAVHRLSAAVNELAVTYMVSFCDANAAETAEEESDAEDLLDQKRYFSALRAYVLSLPDKQRVTVQRFFFEDEKLSDIAEDLEVSVSWASRILSTALSRLKILLEKRPDLTCGDEAE